MTALEPRVAEAGRMRDHGATLQQIADHHQVSVTTAHRWVGQHRAPLPHDVALDAIRLRRAGLSYRAIAITLQHFHQVETTERAIQRLCRTAGIQRASYQARPQNFTGAKSA